MSIRILRTLIAVSESKSFSEAAERVHITHAAISQQMKALEANLGVALFDRSSRTPKLTPLANQVVEKARKIIEDYDTLTMPNLGNDLLHGEIRLGAVPTTLTGLTPQAIAMLKLKFPNIKVYVKSGLSAALMIDIGRGALDAAIISKPHLMPSNVAFHKIADEKMQLVVSADEPDDNPIKLLREKPYIRFNRSEVIGTLIDNWISQKKIRVSETMELDSPEAITSMVEARLGVSIVPEPSVRTSDAQQVKRLDLGADAPKRTLGLVYVENNIRIQIIEELVSALSEMVRPG